MFYFLWFYILVFIEFIVFDFNLLFLGVYGYLNFFLI